MNNIFQSKEWEDFKLATGYQKSYRVNDILVLQKNLPLGWSMLYSPMVSQVQLTGIMNHESGIKGFLAELKAIAAPAKSILYRLELDVPAADHDSEFIIHNSGFGFAKAFEEMQPEHTLVLDLHKSEDELLAEMKQKCRYNIRLASKNNITIEQSDNPGPELDDFYRMYAETAKRHKITHRGKKYFESLLEILGKNGYASVYTAYALIDGRKTPLASAIIVCSGPKVIYMFGSSSDEYKNMMAPYRLHWEIIRESKEKGYKHYDFFGVAPDEDPSHPWAGVTRFKRQFGGEQIDILGSYDLVFNPVKYHLFKMAEKIRRK